MNGARPVGHILGRGEVRGRIQLGGYTSRLARARRAGTRDNGTGMKKQGSYKNWDATEARVIRVNKNYRFGPTQSSGGWWGHHHKQKRASAGRGANGRGKREGDGFRLRHWHPGGQVLGSLESEANSRRELRCRTQVWESPSRGVMVELTTNWVCRGGRGGRLVWISSSVVRLLTHGSFSFSCFYWMRL